MATATGHGNKKSDKQESWLEKGKNFLNGTKKERRDEKTAGRATNKQNFSQAFLCFQNALEQNPCKLQPLLPCLLLLLSVSKAEAPK